MNCNPFKIAAALLLALISFTIRMNGATCTASTGNYSSAATWSCGRIPQSGDDVIIPNGVTVTVDITTSLLSNTNFFVLGTLDFNNAAKIKLDCNSSLWVEPPNGNLTGGNGGSKIEYCGDPNAWTGGQTTYGPFMIGASPLPVQLTAFEGNQDGQTIALTWSTASETNNDHFTVERSVDGIVFEEIGTVKGAGNSTSQKNYSLPDNTPVEGTNYYRLKQTDVNGKEEQFSTIAVEFHLDQPSCVLTVYPNPCTPSCTVRLSDCDEDPNGTISLQLVDMEGRTVLSEIPSRDANGGFTYSMDEHNGLKPGVYIVRAASSRSVYQQKAALK